MTTIDVDAARAAREPVEVVFGGVTYPLAGLPLTAIAALQEGRLEEAAEAVFGKAGKKVLAAGLDVQDLAVIVEGITGGLGNLPASTGS